MTGVLDGWPVSLTDELSSKGIASLGVTLGCPEWPERGDQLDIGGPNMGRVCLV